VVPKCDPWVFLFIRAQFSPPFTINCSNPETNTSGNVRARCHDDGSASGSTATWNMTTKFIDNDSPPNTTTVPSTRTCTVGP
jgi:hypothetical protein